MSEQPANGAAMTKAEPKKGPMTLRGFLEGPEAQDRLSAVATKFLAPRDLVRLALMAASRQPDVLKCSHTSVLRALMDAAEMGIAPGGVMGRGYIVPRWNKRATPKPCFEAAFDPGWRGLCDIARRSGDVKRIDAKVVYAGDDFSYEEGTAPIIRHVPTLIDTDRGDVVAAYAVARFADGETQIEVLTIGDIIRIRDVSAAKGGPWNDWFEEMARKSATRRLCKYLPYSPIMERALAHATDVETGDRTVPDPIDETKPRAKTLAESIRAKTAKGSADAEDPGSDPGLADAIDAGAEERQPGDDREDA